MAIRVASARHSQLMGNIFGSDFDGVEVHQTGVPALEQLWCCCTWMRQCPCWAPPSSGVVVTRNYKEIQDPTLREVLEVDAKAQTLLVGAGYSFKECRPYLDAAGLAFIGAPEYDSITIGGAVATSAHNGGLSKTPLSGYILEIWIRDAMGEVRHFKKGDKHFGAAAVSLGLLGAIVKVRLQLEVAKNIRETRVEVGSFDAAALSTRNDKTHDFEFAPYQQRMVRGDWEETEEPGKVAGFAQRALESVIMCPNQCLIGTVDLVVPCCPSMTMNESGGLAQPRVQVWDKFDNFHQSDSWWTYFIEYNVSLQNAGPCFEKLKAVIAEQQKKGHYLRRMFSRLIKAVPVDHVLALSAGEDTATFEIIWSRRHPGVEEFIDAVIQVFLEFDGRAHLGKLIREKDVPHIAAVYGATGGGQPWLDFEEVRSKMDPEGKFLNKSLKVFVEEATKAAHKALQTGQAGAHNTRL